MKHLLTFAALLATSWAFGQDGCCALMDYDGDRNVSISDFTIFLSNYGADGVPGYNDCIPCYTSVVFDADQQGEIGLSDMLIMLSLFGAADVDFDLIWDSVDQCFDLNSCNYLDVSADFCLYFDAFGECGGSCILDNDVDGICDDEDGCSDPSSCNFNDPLATGCLYLDALGICDGVCVQDQDGDGLCDDVDGCSDSTACNYWLPLTDNCVYSDAIGICGGQCQDDVDGDLRCDDIDNCTDVAACNYDDWGACSCSYSEQSISCLDPNDLDGDGVCDDIDNCNDILACNYLEFAPCGCTYLNSDGFCVGPGDLDGDGFCNEEDGCDDLDPTQDCCGHPLLYQGYAYETVLIGDQCWFAENLRSAKYDNGDNIWSALPLDEWQNITSGATTIYGLGPFICDDYSPSIDACSSEEALHEYGRLYNWYAVDDARGLCPSGWHVPADVEWNLLTESVGGDSLAGVPLKSTLGWNNSGNGTNSSGFGGLPGGRAWDFGHYFQAGNRGDWWTSTSEWNNALWSYEAWAWSLGSGTDGVLRSAQDPQDGLSVRCIRDSD